MRLSRAYPNLITLYAAVSGEGVESIQNRYAGKGYAEFKKNLAELIIEFLNPIQARYKSIAADPAMLAEVLHTGGGKARERSETTLSRVYRAVGFIPRDWGRARPVGGRMSSSEWQSDMAVPATAWALPNRRVIMENIETKDVARAAVAEPDPDMECIEDCCVCCCCDTEEECRMEE